MPTGREANLDTANENVKQVVKAFVFGFSQCVFGTLESGLLPKLINMDSFSTNLEEGTKTPV